MPQRICTLGHFVVESYFIFGKKWQYLMGIIDEILGVNYIKFTSRYDKKRADGETESILPAQLEN